MVTIHKGPLMDWHVEIQYFIQNLGLVEME